MRLIALLCFSLLTCPALAEVYRWTDAQGNTIFGDQPPESARAQAVELPPLTIADSFNNKKAEDKATVTAISKPVEEADSTSQETNKSYTNFSISAPSADETIRANGGSVALQLNIKPELQKGHGIVVYLDGKQVGKTSSTSFTLSEVTRGSHSVFAVLHDAKDKVLTNTESVSFQVLRAAAH
ncbi:DUF4124 domain-containing protein [Thiolinea disciformis]|uniref:DUF4124 domain-containing protein n=1 Tax=Thiolinea disciformis TaxID=125614 RepID=UPI00035CE9E0|nr:DUF4124 domain-containing protein [Thiolinea disciformis]